MGPCIRCRYNTIFHSHRGRRARERAVKERDTQMRSDRAVEWFRPLVGAQQWHYVVLWKLGNDPSRFIEWMGCCCSGGCDSGGVKEEETEKLLCRDNYLKHSVRTKACESLAQFPDSMPLYSGVHTEVVLSREPKWLNQIDHSDSSPSNDQVETRVLIPIDGGLVELCTTNHIPEDHKVLDLVLAHCKKISLDSEQETASPNEAFPLYSPPENRIEKLPFSLQFHSQGLSPSMEAFSSVRQPRSHTGIEGSPSTGNSTSYPCNSHLYFESSFEENPQYKPFKRSPESKRVDHSEEFLRNKVGSVSGFAAEKSGQGKTRRKEKGQYQSSNLMAERERRKRIRNGLLILRSLVPKITKMDMASVLRDAIDYIKELQMDEKELRDKIKEMEEEEEGDEEEEENEDQTDDAKRHLETHLPLSLKTRDLSTFGPKLQTDVEVKQIGERKYFVKLNTAHRRGGFVRLMEAIDSLKLQVISAGLTTFNGTVQNILEIKGERDVKPKKLRDLLIELTS